ncbi:CoB--CoM heterodisulfide reductase iron-sulfur subunit B family protein [Planctomycetota bacterium]
MKVSYYPGCTLKTKAQNLEVAAVRAMEALGVELSELPRWNCCGAVFSLSDDDLIHQIAPVRILARALEQGDQKLVTLCPMCYNTLARANLLMRTDEEKRHTINTFMEEEPDYNGEVEVFHLLGYLKNEVGWDSIREKIKVPLAGLRLAPYYGCTLLRPKEVAIESPYDPTLFKELIELLGAEAVDLPNATECCGSYQVISNPKAATIACARIVRSGLERNANALVVSCPLCDYNLGALQRQMTDGFDAPPALPLLYFTQLLAIALGLDAAHCHFELNHPGARELFEAQDLIVAQAG